MKLGILTTVHLGADASIGQLRLLVDSLRSHMPEVMDRSLLVVDDCSPNGQEYLNWLVSSGTALIYRLGPPRQAYTNRKNNPDLRTSYGHAWGLMAGFHALRQLGFTHAWVIDADCTIVDNLSLAEPLALFDDPLVSVVTDYFGGSSESGTVDRFFDLKLNRLRSSFTCRVPMFLYGFPNLFCAVVDLIRETSFGALNNSGWVNSRWGQRLFRQGYRVGYFPFFQDRHIFHLGYGHTRFNAQLTQPFGNVTETVRYGGKNHGEYHAGYLQLDRESQEHSKWLTEVAQPPYDRKVEMPREWLVDPPQTLMHGRGDYYFRALASSDLSILYEIDSHSEATRFMQWGPHAGRDATKEFLYRTSPDRWFALVNGYTEQLIGYGEIKFLDSESTQDLWVAGLTYVIAPRFWGQGWGTKLLLGLIETASSILDFDAFQVAIDTEHFASLRVLEASIGIGQTWKLLREEEYVLKGETRRRRIFRYTVKVKPSRPSSIDHALERESLLYDIPSYKTEGMWRP